MAAVTTPVGGLAGRYAKALLELAEQQKKLDPVADDLRGLRQLIAESEDLRRLLRSPVFGRALRERAVGAVLDKAGVDPITRNFCMVVVRNNRLFALPQMIEGYLAELARRRGEVTADVATAQPLSDTQLQSLEQALKKAVGGKVKVESKVDPSLIGGMVVRVGSRMIDNSLRSKLNRLQHAMKGAE